MALKIWLDGKLVDEADAKVSVFDHGLLYGDGVFEGIRVYDGRVFELEAHLRRLYESAKVIRLHIPMDKSELVSAIKKTVEANGIVDGYIRLVVTRGAGTLGLNPFLCRNSGLIIIARNYDRRDWNTPAVKIINKLHCISIVGDPEVSTYFSTLYVT